MNKALFLDRDGVININHGYVHSIDDFDFIDGIFALVRRAQRRGFLVIVVTNQSGIGRGMYSEQDFAKLSDWMKSMFSRNQGVINDIFFCPHHPQAKLLDYKVLCECRKPKPGMLIEAARKHNIDLTQSILIGDKVSDLEAALEAGLNEAVWFSPEFADDKHLAQCETKITALAPNKTLISIASELDMILAE